ncbi:hypothetical protein BX666DRAFT_1320229 [Dichotomocladium elegans]|nr:hypothetical protein BX666DRAFT_1320229 [Dichotomocladium elegans]
MCRFLLGGPALLVRLGGDGRGCNAYPLPPKKKFHSRGGETPTTPVPFRSKAQLLCGDAWLIVTTRLRDAGGVHPSSLPKNAEVSAVLPTSHPCKSCHSLS